MTLTSPPTAVATQDKGRLAAGISASATTITVSPIYKTVNGVRTKQGFNSTSGVALITQGDFTERISFEGASVDATTKVTTLTTCVRGLSVTSTTASFAGGTGRAWPKGAKITVVADASYFQSGVFTNVANTFTATNTFTGQVDMDGGFKLPVFADTTARDAFYASPEEGDKAVVTGTGEQVYVGGAWVTTNAAASSFATSTGQGTVEVGVAADNANSTTTGDSGALVVVPTSLVTKTSNGASDENKIPVLNSSGIVANGFLATSGTPDATTVLLGDRTWGAPPASTSTAPRIVAIGVGSSQTSGTSATDFATTYTIPANDLVSGVGYKYTCYWTNDSTNQTTFELKLGSTTIASCVVTPPSASANGGKYEGVIFGTAAAGASVSVAGAAQASIGNGSNARIGGTYESSASVATNGSLIFKLTGTTATSGVTVVSRVVIEKFSTTAF